MKKKMFLMGLIMSVIISVAMGILSSALLIMFNPDIVRTSPVPMIYVSRSGSLAARSLPRPEPDLPC